MDINIEAQRFTADQKLIDLIHKKVSKLETFHDHIVDVDVVLSFESAHSQVKEKSVQIRLDIPGHKLIANKTSKLFEESLDEAVESLRRQIRKLKEKQRN